MIKTFKHKGLKRLFEDDDRSKVTADMAEKMRLILFARIGGSFSGSKTARPWTLT